jgi:hypothetical protein
MCLCEGPSIFVLKREHVFIVTDILTESEQRCICIHSYDNGYLIYVQNYSSWMTSTLILDDKKIFHQKFD